MAEKERLEKEREALRLETEKQALILELQRVSSAKPPGKLLHSVHFLKQVILTSKKHPNQHPFNLLQRHLSSIQEQCLLVIPVQ